MCSPKVVASTCVVARSPQVSLEDFAYCGGGREFVVRIAYDTHRDPDFRRIAQTMEEEQIAPSVYVWRRSNSRAPLLITAWSIRSGREDLLGVMGVGVGIADGYTLVATATELNDQGVLLQRRLARCDKADIAFLLCDTTAHPERKWNGRATFSKNAVPPGVVLRALHMK